jgi:hypothetical protein
MNSDDELLLVAISGLYSGVEAERLLVRKSESGNEFNKLFWLLMLFQYNKLRIPESQFKADE